MSFVQKPPSTENSKPYAEVYLSGLPRFFSWSISHEIPAQPGDLVAVNFRGKSRRGLVITRHTNAPLGRIQPISAIIEPQFLPKASLALAHFVSEHYHCPLPKVLGIFLPPKWDQAHFWETTTALELVDADFAPSSAGQKKLLSYWESDPSKVIPLSEFSAEISAATIRRLCQKGVVKKVTQRADVSSSAQIPKEFGATLSAAQKQALESILADERPSLLWGVTGSGKTEVYQALMSRLWQKDPTAQALLLVPEIALTKQLISRFEAAFGISVGVCHSQITPKNKRQLFQKILRGKLRLVIGARSAITLPFQNLQCLILDEAHEWTYKSEQSPRYRTTALAEYWKHCQPSLKLVLGSATPRAEVWYQAQSKQYQLVQLPEPFFRGKKPQISLLNLRTQPFMERDSLLSPALKEKLEQVVKAEEQAVLFLNRRGWNGCSLCRVCGAFSDCPHCDTHLTFHRFGLHGGLTCHLCGYSEPLPEKCPQCQAKPWREERNFGTQQVENELRKIFPEVPILRADADTITHHRHFEALLRQLESPGPAILLGTQMISKGLDLPRVSMVGILLADIGLGLPFFRSQERVWQLMMQVIGRSGRRGQATEVVIQTLRPNDPVFNFLSVEQAQAFLEQELAHRQKFGWPPFGELARVLFQSPEQHTAESEAQTYAQKIRELKLWNGHVFCAPQLTLRLQGQYRFQVILRSAETGLTHLALKTIPPPPKAVIDIDPEAAV